MTPEAIDELLDSLVHTSDIVDYTRKLGSIIDALILTTRPHDLDMRFMLLLSEEEATGAIDVSAGGTMTVDLARDIADSLSEPEPPEVADIH